ncbi:acetylgalactosaminyl-O-glycosyl-glycoprotein beta-1,3-N-acetylglucosaminyltransferase-like [Ornithodoros turicata]|uniref:acetylgalactosaminyl-O-glycosyl-glycoprotein beta-1,3-N-acetylglucosaminyltransferase-like n=1 Tax=Ornithodoros turicata TaxID=34597 RepID=UPI0031389636
MSILLQDTSLVHSRDYSLKYTTERSVVEDIEYIGGSATIEAFRRGVDILFYVNSAPSNFPHHAVYRDTLGHAAMLGFWNSAIVFVMGCTEDPTLEAWNTMEADIFGDTVILPFEDIYANLVHKFTTGLYWMSVHCPNVKHVIKLDDDVSVRFVPSSYATTSESE